MRITRIFLFLCSCASIAHGQKPPMKFGDVPIEQLMMTRYEKVSSAGAVVAKQAEQIVLKKK